MNKKILSALFSLLIITPIITFAQNSDVDPQGSSSCVLIQNNLRYRTTDAQTGGDISVLQDFLQASGYLKVGPSGYFGLQTFAGVKSFQSANGISPTGYVGPLTRAKIQVVSCDGTTANISTNSISSNQNGNSAVSGCNVGALFNSTTGVRCSTNTTATAATAGTVSSDSIVFISSVTPQTAQVGQSLTVYFKNGGDNGSVMLKTRDGSKSWHVPYTTGTVYNGFVYYDGSKVTLNVPATIGKGYLPENSGYEQPISLTSGTYNLFVFRSTPSTIISGAFPIIISAGNIEVNNIQRKAVITNIDYAGNTSGTITANEKASIHGTGLSGRLTIKLGNQEPQFVTVTSTSDTYVQFTVPSRTQDAAVSVAVTNSSGVTSDSYPVNITVHKKEPFVVTFPTEGVTLDAGSTYNLTWTGSDINMLYYTVRLVGGPYGTISLFLGNADASTKSFSFTIPAIQGSTVWPGSNYKIQVGGQNDTGGVSPSFNIRDPYPAVPGSKG